MRPIRRFAAVRWSSLRRLTGRGTTMKKRTTVLLTGLAMTLLPMAAASSSSITFLAAFAVLSVS